ncbi:MAG: ABC transporter permease, partial [Microbacteriaceae bacterium]|nr:ABC transporter permease [Microbacteriaceae bacterium]
MTAPVRVRAERSPADIRPSRTTQVLVLVVVGLVFAVPIVAMLEFSLRAGLSGGYTLEHWATVLGGRMPPAYQKPLVGGILNSLLLAVLTIAIVLVILVPTQILVHLRFPKLRRVLEFVCLVPITIPAIVLVVGLAPVYSVIARMFGSGAWTLCFAYGILVLPYTYRAIQSNLSAVDLHTLTE